MIARPSILVFDEPGLELAQNNTWGNETLSDILCIRLL